MFVRVLVQTEGAVPDEIFEMVIKVVPALALGRLKLNVPVPLFTFTVAVLPVKVLEPEMEYETVYVPLGNPDKDPLMVTVKTLTLSKTISVEVRL